MSLPCSIESCPRTSTSICYNCNKKLCPEHLEEHDEYLNSQLRPISNHIRDLSSRYTLINTKKLLNDFREQLDKWRNESHKTIDRLYKEKSEELKRDWPQRLNKPQKELDQIRTKNIELTRREKTTHEDIEQLHEAIRSLDQQINDIEQKGIEIDIRPISFNDLPTQQTGEIKSGNLIDLSIPYRAIDCSNESKVSFIGNHQNLLIYENRTLTLLNRDFNSIEQISWTHGHIIDMSWSTILNNFIVITDKRTVYRVRESPFEFKHVEEMPQEQWWSCTCSDQYLFVSTHGIETFIFQFNIRTKFETIKYWRSPSTCKQNQFIQNIRYNNQSLALIIVDSIEKTAWLEVRSSNNLNRLWSFSIDIADLLYQPVIHLCLIKTNQWIIIIENTSQIYHVDKYGKLISIYEYKPPVWNSTLFASNILAIRTENKIIFHKI